MSSGDFLPIPSTGIPRLDPTVTPSECNSWGHEARIMWWLGDPARQEGVIRLEIAASEGVSSAKKRIHIEVKASFAVAEPVPSLLGPIVVAGNTQTNHPEITPTAPSPAPAPPPPADKEETATQPNGDADDAIHEFDDSYNEFLKAQRKET
jgi:hypothetical protein